MPAVDEGSGRCFPPGESCHSGQGLPRVAPRTGSWYRDTKSKKNGVCVSVSLSVVLPPVLQTWGFGTGSSTKLGVGFRRVHLLAKGDAELSQEKTITVMRNWQQRPKAEAQSGHHAKKQRDMPHNHQRHLKTDPGHHTADKILERTMWVYGDGRGNTWTWNTHFW